MSKSNSSETTEEQQEALDRQPFMAHLIEFRDRVLRIFISILVIFAGLFSFSQDLYLYVSEPIREFLPESSTMIATEVASPFLTPFPKFSVLSFPIGFGAKGPKQCLGHPHRWEMRPANASANAWGN